MGPFVKGYVLIVTWFFDARASLVVATGALLVSVAVGLAASERQAANTANVEEQRSWSNTIGGRPGPPSVFNSFIPVCYRKDDGRARLVRPWNSRRESVPNCKPPAPWDQFNIPTGGWSDVACTTGGSFDC